MTPGAKPHDMSAAAHMRQSRAEDRLAKTHTRQYDPKATVERSRCLPRGGRGGAEITADVCWTSISNQTSVHLRAAEEHRRHAASHRAASASLRDVESRACVGIATDDRDISPFEHVEDIASVEPLIENVGARKIPAGAIVNFRPVPGMTTEWLQHVMDCHLARNASLGHVTSEMPNCPLVPRGAQASVRSTGSGFAVAIRSDDPTSAREILARALRLQSAHVNPSASTK